MKQHLIFDTEFIGETQPVFLVCAECLETGERFRFWHHQRGFVKKLWAKLSDARYTWVGFNSNAFDRVLLSAAVCGADLALLQALVRKLIDERLRAWDAARLFGFELVDFDHIDLKEVAPGVMVSLKAYMARLNYPTLQDLPFDHTRDLDPKEQKLLERYCWNDIGGTKALFLRLHGELALRRELGAEHGLDLRSKSDAQMAEAILKKAIGLGNRAPYVPSHVTYTAPKFLRPKHPILQQLLARLEAHDFVIDRQSGSPEFPAWLEEPLELHGGTYQVGLGGLHSQHDKRLYLEAGPDQDISDIDAGSFYPTTILNAGLVPRMAGDKGQVFLDHYRDLYQQRLSAKAKVGELGEQLRTLASNGATRDRLLAEIAHWKVIADRLKISLNGTFGKLGSLYSSFYSPDLMLAVTLTGQLVLLCLIDTLSKIKGVRVVSANTDGIMITYPPAQRAKVMDTVARFGRQMKYEFEETRYRTVALKDVNNYIAITTTGKAKAKGLYAEAGLSKNPTMPACSEACIAYLKDRTPIATTLRRIHQPAAFMAVRGVSGIAIQHTRLDEIDDWVLVHDTGSAKNLWMRQAHLDAGRSPDDPGGGAVQRKSRPKPVLVGSGGVPLGRVARWYMTTDRSLPPIQQVSNGNTVPKTTGARACMTLPDRLPEDLDWAWYEQEAAAMLEDMGVTADFSLPHSDALLQSV